MLFFTTSDNALETSSLTFPAGRFKSNLTTLGCLRKDEIRDPVAAPHSFLGMRPCGAATQVRLAWWAGCETAQSSVAKYTVKRQRPPSLPSDRITPTISAILLGAASTLPISKRN
jgi:hypothetical protein